MPDKKTIPHDGNVYDFIRTFAITEQKRQDSFELLQLMEECTGCKPVMWGPSIIGFGSYHYKSERSTAEGDWPLVGFSPRTAAISLYVYSGCQDQDDLLKDLGKYKMGKACIYVKRLSDINKDVLKSLIEENIRFLKSKYG